MVRRGNARSAVKTDPENTRLAARAEHDCQYCDQRVTNQVIFYEKRFTAYKQEPYWYSRCTNCKLVLNHRY
jgi:hypothetical protein